MDADNDGLCDFDIDVDAYHDADVDENIMSAFSP